MTAALQVTGLIRIDDDTTTDQLWVRDGRISFEPGEAEQTIEGFAIPGLIDAHCHIGLDAHGPVDAETAERQAITDRDAGTLLIRDAGSPSDTRWIDDRADLPKIIRAGRHLARTRRYIPNFAHEIEPDQLPEYMAAQARAGDGWVKIVGDWIDRSTGDLEPCWPDDAVTAGIQAAHEAGARVTAHCFAEASLHQLANAGIDCVEHATGLTDETIALFAAKDIAIVPTLVNIRQFPRLAEPAVAKFPKYHAHMIDLWRRRLPTIAKAHEAGIRIYAGTDAGGVLPHGLIAEEVHQLTLAAMSAGEAVGAASWRGREWLGRPGITQGEDADFVVYPADPLLEPEVLRYPRAIVLRGRLIT